LDYGCHIGFEAKNLRWPRSIFQIVWSKVHESTEKTLTGKRAVFTWLGPYYIVHHCIYLIDNYKAKSSIDCEGRFELSIDYY